MKMLHVSALVVKTVGVEFSKLPVEVVKRRQSKCENVLYGGLNNFSHDYRINVICQIGFEQATSYPLK